MAVAGRGQRNMEEPETGTLNNPNCGGLLCTPILNISPVLPTSAQQFPTTLNLDMERRPRDIQDRPEPGIYEIPCKPKARNEPGKLGDQSLYPSCDQKDRPPSNGPISTTSIDPEQTNLTWYKKKQSKSRAPAYRRRSPGLCTHHPGLCRIWGFDRSRLGLAGWLGPQTPDGPGPRTSGTVQL